MLHHRKGNFAEASISIAATMLATLLMLNVSLAAYTANTAVLAANYGARTGSVAASGAQSKAQGAANLLANETGLAAANYSIAAYADEHPFGFSTVVVSWQMPAWYSGLAAFFGGTARDFSGFSVVSYKREGW